jgi:hypothetical protein
LISQSTYVNPVNGQSNPGAGSYSAYAVVPAACVVNKITVWSSLAPTNSTSFSVGLRAGDPTAGLSGTDIGCTVFAGSHYCEGNGITVLSNGTVLSHAVTISGGFEGSTTLLIGLQMTCAPDYAFTF